MACCPSLPEAGFAPLHHAAWYLRLHARMLAHGLPHYERAVAARKRQLFGPLRGNIAEIGPGAGVNMNYYSPAVQWTGVEPNPCLHPLLERKAAEAGLRGARIHLGVAEALPFAGASLDAVTSTLVLCTVRDPGKALREIGRVLKPGGRFVFIEHTAEPESRWRAVAQRLVRPLWEAVFDGCQPHRDIGAALAAAGFTRIEAAFFRAPLPLVGPHLAGYAVR